MSEIMQEVQKKLTFPIDFASQRRADTLVFRVLLFGTITACFVGFLTQSVVNLVWCFGISYFLSLLAVLPSYPWYNKQRPTWVKTKIGS
ncbi:LAMI_0A07734g1_1 [Lachancea mirantina]|uniref:Signal peptidase complex subunit 1 n=1 Tax=Lachancea mirantina TaxID=1230905 RepID=A0A1G4IR42_9SACH|nr:LAMI_0A07734g1_1 [Lachancea mirantina]